MPANKKHLESSIIQRILKITAGLFGGFLVSTTFHMFLMYFFPSHPIYTTMFVTGYVLWTILFIMAFIIGNGYKIWLAYIVLTLVFYSPYLIAPIHT